MNIEKLLKEAYLNGFEDAQITDKVKGLKFDYNGMAEHYAQTKVKNLDICGVMPRRLTAENGAKGLLIGEFHETIVCHDDEGEPYEVKIPVEWDTIKQIYAKIVDYYGA